MLRFQEMWLKVQILASYLDGLISSLSLKTAKYQLIL